MESRFFETSKGSENWFENRILRDIGAKIVVFDSVRRWNDFWFELSEGSKK